jgi:hypothetical protein
MKRTALLMAVGVTVLLALVVGAALATPPKEATTTPLTRATLGNFEANSDGIEVESERRSADIAIAAAGRGEIVAREILRRRSKKKSG